MFKLLRSKKGAALAEYSMLVAGIMLVGAAAVSVFGHKTSDMMGATAAILPGAHADDNGPIVSGKIIETAGNGVGEGGTSGIALDVQRIAEGVGSSRLGNGLGTGTSISTLVLEPGEAGGGGDGGGDGG